jgi:hypothetical protein
MFKPCIIVVAMIWSILAHGHHSVMGAYDESSRITIEVVVNDFQFVYPHPFIYVEIIAASDSRLAASIGTGEQWRLEMDNKVELVDLGFTSKTLTPGDKIFVTVDPSRNKSYAMYVRVLEHQTAGFRYEHNQRQLFY